MALLKATFAECLAGKGTVVAVSGPVASGKTELLQIFAEYAADQGAVVLQAAGSHAERDVPLVVMGQLFRSAAQASPRVEGVARLLAEGSLTAALSGYELEATGQSAAQMLHSLCLVLLDLARQRPVVVCVDGEQYADVPSLQCLLTLARRMASSRILLVLTENASPHALFRAELLAQPHCRHVRLTALSAAAVARMLAQRQAAARMAAISAISRMAAIPTAGRVAAIPASGGATTIPTAGGTTAIPTAGRVTVDAPVEQLVAHPDAGQLDDLERRAAAYHAASGGNLLLVRALIEDGTPVGTTPLPVGTTFVTAVLESLRRGDPVMRATAQAIAVLDGEPATDGLLGQMLDVAPQTAAAGVESLTAAGLLESGRFRHPVTRDTVLDKTPADDRARLHRRAAQLLHADGAHPTVVARHLVAAEHVDEPWAVTVLVEAASQTAPATAVACLTLASRAPVPDSERAGLLAMLAHAGWRVDPAASRRHMPDLIRAVATGQLRGGAAIFAIKHILWYGGQADAASLLATISASGDDLDPEVAVELGTARAWLGYVHPPLLAQLPNRPGPSPEGALTSVTVGPPLQAATALVTVLRQPAPEEMVGVAEQVLQRTRLDDSLIEPVLAALLTLIYLDRSTKAAAWCEVLLSRATVTRYPTWHALTYAAQAEAVLRQGDLPAAEHHARSALVRISPEGWGVALGFPLGTLIMALTGMGRYDEAAVQLKHAVPDAMFDTCFGLHYQHARGRYLLATDRPESALRDFQACGDLLARWGMDPPALVSWRTDAARALVRLDQHRSARELVERQMSALRSGYARTRGMALRVLATTATLRQRRQLLRDAVDVLQASGDRFELAGALADLSEAYYALGESNQARLMVRRAHHLARVCRAEPLCESLLPNLVDAGVTTSAPHTNGAAELDPLSTGLTSLSEAERRVAVLAAQGHSNREIARKLYITNSTVEQHLTRVYRKLDVNRRSDLPVKLQL